MRWVSENMKHLRSVNPIDMPTSEGHLLDGGDKNPVVYVLIRRHAILLLRHLVVSSEWHSPVPLTWITGVSTRRVATTLKQLERFGLVKVVPKGPKCMDCPKRVRTEHNLHITPSGRATLFVVEGCLHTLRRHASEFGIASPESWGPVLGWIPRRRPEGRYRSWFPHLAEGNHG